MLAWCARPAASALAVIGVAAIPELVAAPESPRQWVRVHAGHALGRIRQEQAAPALFRALNSPDYLVRTYAGNGLDAMGLLDEILLF
ncbi:MAG TPA: HEAT repeat domain-containing protein [Anaerolineae bacterium]|nr:HEAT repeat domain-containing protein [Anaerolineae bacterium]